MNIKQKIELHDRLYNHADKLLKKHNPCKIKDGKCIVGKCCCDNCEHLTENGCGVWCLRCKLYLCWEARSNSPLSKTLARILQKAYRHNILGHRHSREQILKELHIWEKLDMEMNNERKTKSTII
jgi:hypothetical protein